jgi:hypothetical protein
MPTHLPRRAFRFPAILNLFACLAFIATASTTAAEKGQQKTPQVSYSQTIAADAPAAYWDLGTEVPTGLTAFKIIGNVKLGADGPPHQIYPGFDKDNLATKFAGGGARLVIQDPGDDSPLDFKQGDTITLEAWVNTDNIPDGQQRYIIGKGRTGNKGFSADNQNYALRLRGTSNGNVVSFLFRSVSDKGTQSFHRWNSSAGIPAGSWHHVAVKYTFGKPEDVVAYIDGKPSGGDWDLGGPTKNPPVVDNDEVWIGSSMGGNPSSSFIGTLDEVAIHRRALSAETMAKRYEAKQPEFIYAHKDLPKDAVRVDIYEGVSDKSWERPFTPPTFSYEVDSLAFTQLPRKYDERAVLIDRTNPYRLVAQTRWTAAEAGDYRFLLRSLNGARLFINDKQVATTPFKVASGGDNLPVPSLENEEEPWIRVMPVGHTEKLATVSLPAGEHRIRLEAAIGGNSIRMEAGELCVAVAPADRPLTQLLRVLSPTSENSFELSDLEWDAFEVREFAFIRSLNQQTRLAVDETFPYWQNRHAIARQTIADKQLLKQPAAIDSLPANNLIDHYLNQKLAANEIVPSADSTDLAFLRRLALDTVGVLPSKAEIDTFLADAPGDRRSNAIDRFLADPRWADHWVPFWQDLLAENPNILKPTLNNTGPFRVWIYESMVDNKPLDRFVTELVRMGGSKYAGGPAGFSIATENDVPMAAKAHVLSRAFLGLELSCARCHDAPFHDYQQKQLFSAAAMLLRKPIKLPESSTVPRDGGRDPLVTSSLKVGEVIAPEWGFSELIGDEDFPAGLEPSKDTREQLALLFTNPANSRFADVIVNRIWAKFLGQGIVEPLDDWDDPTPSHPELLAFLSRELTSHGYDMKHVAKLILNSAAYQRQPSADSTKIATAENRTFAAPARRRMSAEQLLDSLFTMSGKPLRSEDLSLDPASRRPYNSFLNLGSPRRAWEFASLSNERDRPSLALPMAQHFSDILQTFGWRNSRPDPISRREEPATVIQPLILANGVIGSRATQLSDDHTFTAIALDPQRTPETLTEELFLRVLTRQPSSEEKSAVVALLSVGFEDRLTKVLDLPAKPRMRNGVTWTNHLHPDANSIKLKFEEMVRKGDPPTAKLNDEWRQRMEDAIWALLNSPEFVFLP